jgi:hypothetical protein
MNRNDRILGRFDWWRALVRVLSSIEAVRDGRAMYVLLASFSGAGLAVAMARSSLARAELPWAIGQGAAALFIAFYGSNAAGLLLMDRARGGHLRSVMDALEDSLGIAHRVFMALAVVLLGAALVLGTLVGLVWLSDLPKVGPWLYALVVPLTVIVLGLLFMVGGAVVGPLTGPTVWSGASSWQAVRMLWWFLRERLLQAAVLMVGLSLVTGLVGAAVSFVVISGGRLMAEVSVWLLGIDVPPEVLMAGLFGHGLQSINLAEVPKSALPHTMAALVGGGIVFALALVLPTLVYLRGVCEIYLALAAPVLPSAGADSHGQFDPAGSPPPTALNPSGTGPSGEVDAAVQRHPAEPALRSSQISGQVAP